MEAFSYNPPWSRHETNVILYEYKTIEWEESDSWVQY